MLRFRESFRGYNRDDVNAYIEQINLHFSKKEAELRAVIADLEAKSAQNVFNRKEEDFVALLSEIEALKAENTRLKSDLVKANQSIENELEEKSKLYDSMSAQVGSIIIQANTNADKIVSEAKIEAENIKIAASIRSKEIIEEAAKKKDETIRTIEEILYKASSECISEYSQIIGDANGKLRSISDNAILKAESMLKELENKTSLIKGE